jgi:hypothetical protein
VPYFSNVQFHDCTAGSKTHQLDLGNDYAITEIRGNGRDLTATNVFHHVVDAIGHPPTVINNVDVSFVSSGV